MKLFSAYLTSVYINWISTFTSKAGIITVHFVRTIITIQLKITSKLYVNGQNLKRNKARITKKKWTAT